MFGASSSSSSQPPIAVNAPANSATLFGASSSTNQPPIAVKPPASTATLFGGSTVKTSSSTPFGAKVAGSPVAAFGNTTAVPLSSSASSNQPPESGKTPPSTATLFGGNASTASSSSTATPFGTKNGGSPAAGSTGASFVLAGAPFQSASISKPSMAATTFAFGNANNTGGSVPSAPVFGTGIDTGTTSFSTSSSTFGGTKTGSPLSSFGMSSFGGSPKPGFGITSFGVAPSVSSSPIPSFGGIGVPSAPVFGTGKGIAPVATGSSTFGSTSFSSKRSTAGVGLFGSVAEGGPANAASVANVGNLPVSDNSSNKKSNSSSDGAGVVTEKQNSSFTKFRG